MVEVVLHVYDVTNCASDKTNNTIVKINKFLKDGIGLGGIFHCAVQVYGDEEWSFGFCENGSGVFSCPSSKNPMYTYRECIVLGETNCLRSRVNEILRDLCREWPGNSYDLLSKNCNHFCDEFCERLRVQKLPAWVNRFANAGDVAVGVAGTTALRFRQAKTEILSASKTAYNFLVGIASNVQSSAIPDSPSNSNTNMGNMSRLQGPWFKNLVSMGVKPTSDSETPSPRVEIMHQDEKQPTKEMVRN